MIIGYARVSTEEQNLDRQIDALKAAGAEKIFMEKMTGTKSDRPKLNEMLEYGRPGDVILVSELTRLSRGTKDLISLSEKINEKGMELISLKEKIDTTSATGKLMFGMLAVMSQFERDLIVERTKEGLRAARARGKKGGRPKKSTEVIQRALRLYDSKEYTIPEITEMTGLSKGTLYRAINERKAEGEKVDNNN